MGHLTANYSLRDLGHVKIGKWKLKIMSKMPNTIVRFTPSIFPLKNMTSHISQYRFAAKYLKGKIVLDVACGSGYGSELLRQNGNEVLGIDIDPENVEFAERAFKGCYKVGNAEDLKGLEDKTFDAVVSIQTIEHLWFLVRLCVIIAVF